MLRTDVFTRYKGQWMKNTKTRYKVYLLLITERKMHSNFWKNVSWWFVIFDNIFLFNELGKLVATETVK